MKRRPTGRHGLALLSDSWESANRTFAKRYGLERQPCHWNMDDAELVFRFDRDEVVAEICAIGTVSRSAGTFCWALRESGKPPVRNAV